jgi:penicillin amidase
VKLLFGFICIVLFAGIIFFITSPRHKTISVAGLNQSVTIEFDQFSNPSITAQSKADAFYALGYLTASERMFQMDLMRRKSSGNLAEIFGRKALRLDKTHRHLGFQKLAENIIATLPADQLQILRAYTTGVNAYLDHSSILAAEFLALRYQPKRWHETDSILVSLGMFELLNDNATDERMMSVMQRQLPAAAVRFLTPARDIYNAQVYLFGNQVFNPSAEHIPVKALQKINTFNQHQSAINLVKNDSVSIGSNQWATNNTKGGRAIIANDMHLPLAVPNLWYQAKLNYGEVTIFGITLPGLPMIIAGSSQKIAWGYTNAQADVLDLVPLQINPDNTNQYKTSQGWRNFKLHSEAIRVKGEQDSIINLRHTQWGPVSTERLLGKEVAIQWTVFHPEAINLALLNIDQANTIEQAITLFNQAGLPPLNVLLADDKGNIAWTLTGKLPRRNNFDGSISLAREQADIGWDGLQPARHYPKVLNPPSGILTTANNRTLANQDNFLIGHNFAHGFRAYRIAKLLSMQEEMDENFLHTVQLDTQSDFYFFYRQLALSSLTDDMIKTDAILADVKTALQNWNGHANADSTGFGLLVEFRQALKDIIFSSYLQQCKTVDPQFKYHWLKMDTPLRLLLTHKIPETLPGRKQFSSWTDLIVNTLIATAKDIQQRFPKKNIARLTWGEMHEVQLQHPFSHAFPWLGFLLDMPTQPLTGCSFCVRVASANFGASMRLVVSPGHAEEMILVTPTGQSGHPLSKHYQDKYPYWVKGKKIRRNQSPENAILILKPQAEAMRLNQP